MEVADQGSVRYNKKSKQSKNVVSERRRRQKMNKLLYTLRSLVPNISKMDKASILGDAIEYVNDLKQKVERAQSDVQSSSVSPGSNFDGRIDQETDSLTLLLDTAAKHGSNRKYLLQVETRVVGEDIVELRIKCKKESGVLFQLTTALEGLPLELKNASFTTLNEYLLLNIVLQAEGDMSNDGVREAMEDAFAKKGLVLTSGDTKLDCVA